jgi:hypothetical protein
MLSGVVVQGVVSWWDLGQVLVTCILQFPQPMTFDGYAWFTANDVIERDPVSWTLEGSNDGSVYTTLSTQTDVAVTQSRKAQVDPFAVVCCVNV